MGLAGLSFAAGLGTGYMNQSQYQDRQDQIAREQALRDAEFQMRKSAMDEALAERAQERANRQAVANAAKDAEVKTSTTLDTGDGAKVYDMANAQDVAASDARQFRRNAEETTGEPAMLPKLDSATTVNGKVYDSQAAGLKAAAEYNDPVAKSLRVAAAMEAAGRPDAAMDYRAKAEKFRSDLYEAQRNALFNKGSELIAGKRYEGLADAYNKHYKDGRSALFVPSGAGGVFVISDEKTNAEVGRIPVTGDANADIMTWQQMVYPEKAAASAAEQERALSKPFDLKPGEARYMFDKASGKPVQVASNDRMTSAEGRMATTGLGGSGASTRGSGSRHSDQSAIDVAAEKLKNSSWSEQQYLTAKSYLPQILDLNKGPGGATINADVAAWAAGEALDPKRVVPKFNDQTWAVGRAVVHPSGRSVFVSDTGSTPEESAAAMKDGVPAAFRSIQQKDPKSATLMLRAAAGDVKAGNELHASAEAELRARAIRENPGAKPEDIDRVVGPAVERVDAINTYRIAAINKHAPDLMKPYLAQGVPSNARPGATPDRAGTSALPADINDRVQKRAAGLAAAKAVAEQKRAQDDAALEKARMEIGGMTVEQAAQLTGKEATKIRNDPFLWRVLPANVQRVVTTRAY